jgi:hypothetical protein
VTKLKNIQLNQIYSSARLYLEPSDPKLHPNLKDHLGYIPCKYKTLVIKYNGCIKSVFTTGDLDPTDPLINPKVIILSNMKNIGQILMAD